MSKNIKNKLLMLIALNCYSKSQIKELSKNWKPDTIKSICECVINIIDKNIKVRDQEQRKIHKNRDKIRELVNPRRISQKKRKKISRRKTWFLSSLVVACPWNFGGSPLGECHRSIHDQREEIRHGGTGGVWNATQQSRNTSDLLHQP